MRTSNRMKAILIGSIVLFVFAISNKWFFDTPKAEAAAAAPATTITKKTLYTGYTNYTIKFKNLASKVKPTFKSSNNKVVTVTSQGIMKPVAKGSATITILIKQNNKSYTSKIAVTVKTPYIKITNGVKELGLEESLTLKAKTYGLKNASVEWTSSNSKLATIGKTSGKLIVKAVGEVTLTAKDKVSGKKASMTLTIKSKAKPTPTTRPTPTPTPKPTPIPTSSPKPTEQITYKTVFNTGFEAGSAGFVGRGGSEMINTTASTAKTGRYSLLISNRTKTWHGAVLNLSETLKAGKTYQVTAWVKQSSAPNLRIQCTIEKNNGEQYMPFGSVEAKKDTWTKLEGTIFLPTDIKITKFYFESSASATADIYVDDVEITEVVVNMDYIKSTPSLAEAYKKYFDIGAALSGSVLYSANTNELILHHFSTITLGNEMKPQYLLDHKTSTSDLSKYNESPAINTTKMEEYLQYAKEKGIRVRFHVLVWHSQTPRWFFAENYSEDPNAPLVSKEIMLKRLENYIKKVMDTASKYPGVIYAWDVVNEAIEIGHNKPNGYRANDSLWYQIVGEEFVEKSFEYARKYSYDDAALFYNDYNTYQTAKRTAIYNLAKKLKGKGLIDGIGMQTHIDMYYPNLSDFEATVRKFAELGLEIQMTEVDMHNNQNTSEAYERQAVRYGELFEIMLRLKKEGVANITNVTFWGTLDSTTWLTRHRGETSYPLLFDKDGKTKPAFYKVIEVVK